MPDRDTAADAAEAAAELRARSRTEKSSAASRSRWIAALIEAQAAEIERLRQEVVQRTAAHIKAHEAAESAMRLLDPLTAEIERLRATVAEEGRLPDVTLVCDHGCGQRPHRWRPSPEAGPHWRCSDCGEVTAPLAGEPMPAVEAQAARLDAVLAECAALREEAVAHAKSAGRLRERRMQVVEGRAYRVEHALLRAKRDAADRIERAAKGGW